MFIKAFQSIFIKKYSSYVIYAHNFSSFDGIFILKLLSSHYNIIPLIKDGKIIQITVNFREFTFTFRDSYLILPSSLRKLAKSFSVSEKSYFPYEFVNNINLNYIGPIPDFKYWVNITLEEFNSIKTNIWNLKSETIKYCEQDCITLYEILVKFNELIFQNWSINIHKYPTLPSLTFGIFRSNFLEMYTIPKIGGTMFNDIRESYTGGHTDIYHGFGKNLNIYDINSLYPTAMKFFDMPVGPVYYFEGNIDNFKSFLKNLFNDFSNKKAFGFFYVKVTTPEFMERPLLQVKVKTNSGFRTIAPLGSWEMWIFSEEMECYKQYGYKFEIIKGYAFQRANLFEEFIDSLYHIKQNTDKSDPMYLISKLLMNSLYGRFGMDVNLSVNIILKNNEIKNFVNNNIIVEDIIDLKNGKSLLVYKSNTTVNDDNTDNWTMVNIAIASAITAYSRIIMSKYLGDPSIKVWMTDTDSLVTDSVLETGNGLGEFKLEKTCSEMTFIAPKVYGGIETNNTEFTKVKGYKNNLPYSELKSLLSLDNILSLEQTKSYKSLIDANISVKDQLYSLQITDSKREIIFENQKFAYTKPYVIDNSKTIVNCKTNFDYLNVIE
jgi:hypothetical protein